MGNPMMICLSLITILTLCGVQSMKNGRWADDTEFPFVVSIQHQLFHLCSGTIIDQYHILTVAHMVIPHQASDLLVVSGMSIVEFPYNTAVTVKNIYRHPDYEELMLYSFGQSNLYWANDIAILRLTEPLSLNFLIGLDSFSTTNVESYRCFDCIMISWNYPDESNRGIVVQMWDIVYVMENNRCEQWGIHILANQQCFIDFVETDFISTEDLGSPIVCGNSIVGLIVNKAREGQATSPATFLSTLNYTEFISEIINGGEMNVQPGEFPYMVSIWHAKKHACGGLIVNTHQVITVGRCLQGNSRLYSKNTLKIAAGSNEVSLFHGSVQWYPVSHIEIYPYNLPSHCLNDSSLCREHNIGLITLSTPFSWSPTVQRFILADVDDFRSKQLCQVLHWTRKYTEGRIEYEGLTKFTAKLVDYRPPLMELRNVQIAAEELYSINSPKFTDIGNPIICGGHPLGIMVKTHPINWESQTPQIIFLRLRSYGSTGLFNLE